jgi:hypothetical protein
MNINDLTIGQARELAAMFANTTPTAAHPSPSLRCHPVAA